MSVRDVFFNIVCPTLGVIIALTMFSTPMRSVLRARREKALGDLNPVPWVVTFVNCMGWVIYACFKLDIYIFLTNCPGTALGLFYSMSAATILARKDEVDEEARKMRQLMEFGLLFGVVFWSILCIGLAFYMGDSESKKETATDILGYTLVICVFMYYCAPMSTLYTVIKTRDSSSLYAPMIFINLINAMLWLFYGSFGVHDSFVAIPNGAGVILSIIQLCFVCIFKNSKPDSAQYGALSTNEDDGGVNSHIVKVVQEGAMTTSLLHEQVEKKI